MTDSLAQATARRIDAQQQWAQVQGSDALSLPEVQSNKAVQDLVSQRAQLQAALQEERQRHTEEYPSVRETAAKIAELNGQIGVLRIADQGLVPGPVHRRRAAGAADGGHRRRVARRRHVRARTRRRLQFARPRGRNQQGVLRRTVAALQGSGGGGRRGGGEHHGRRSGVAAAVGGFARWAANLALAGISGLLLALVIGGVRERMHNVIRSTDDLEQGLNLPALGVVPRLVGPGQAADGLRAIPGRAMRRPIIRSRWRSSRHRPGGLPKTLLITSSTASEGKSTSASGIARSLSAMGKRVVVVDADLRRAAGGVARQRGSGQPRLVRSARRIDRR